jgi:AcrR family transcriptional regulator
VSDSYDTLQAQIQEARRKQILDAATKVFSQSGYHKATIKQIAKEAAVADGTIYNYFKNKEELLLGILDRLNESDQRQAQFQASQGADMRTFFVGYVRHRMGVLRQNVEVFRVLLPELITNKALQERYITQTVEPSFVIAESYFQALQTVGVIRPINLKLAVRTLASTFLGLLLLHIMNDPQTSAQWEQLPEIAADILWSGLQNK